MNKSVTFLFAFFLLNFSVYAQVETVSVDTTKPVVDTPPYLKYPTLPAFNIMDLDSTTIFNTYNIPKGQPIALMYFDPDCKHCKATMKALIAGMDSLSNILFYMFTPKHDYEQIIKFKNNYRLMDCKNIRMVGRDYDYFFFAYYKVKFVPDIALYDGDKKLIKLFEGSATVKQLYEAVHKNRQ